MLAGAALLLSACGGQPTAVPTIGSPSPTPTQTAPGGDRGSQLAREWQLTGVPLPPDWPDIPLPARTEVITAYAIGSEPRRTWTATFAADRGTALDLAEPVVAALRERDYVPIAEYVGAAATNTGLYSFAAPTFAIYVVLGEDDSRPNLVITVRGSTDESAGLPDTAPPVPPNGTPSSPSGSASPSSPSASPIESQTGSPPSAPTGSSSAAPSA